MPDHEFEVHARINIIMLYCRLHNNYAKMIMVACSIDHLESSYLYYYYVVINLLCISLLLVVTCVGQFPLYAQVTLK